MAGYSGTPLAKKLGISAGMTLHVVDAPSNYRELVDPLPEGARLVTRVTTGTTMVHLFATDREALQARLRRYRDTLGPEAIVWVSWPKKSAKVPTTVTEDVIRTIALPMGWVDIKVCAVDETWSGLKLVVRKTLR